MKFNCEFDSLPLAVNHWAAPQVHCLRLPISRVVLIRSSFLVAAVFHISIPPSSVRNCNNPFYSFHHRVCYLLFTLTFGCQYRPRLRFVSLDQSMESISSPSCRQQINRFFAILLSFFYNQGWGCWNLVRSLCEAHSRLQVTGSICNEHTLLMDYSLYPHQTTLTSLLACAQHCRS